MELEYILKMSIYSIFILTKWNIYSKKLSLYFMLIFIHTTQWLGSELFSRFLALNMYQQGDRVLPTNFNWVVDLCVTEWRARLENESSRVQTRLRSVNVSLSKKFWVKSSGRKSKIWVPGLKFQTTERNYSFYSLLLQITFAFSSVIVASSYPYPPVRSFFA